MQFKFDRLVFVFNCGVSAFTCKGKLNRFCAFRSKGYAVEVLLKSLGFVGDITQTIEIGLCFIVALVSSYARSTLRKNVTKRAYFWLIEQKFGTPGVSSFQRTTSS